MNPDNPNFRTTDEWFDACERLSQENRILQAKLVKVAVATTVAHEALLWAEEMFVARDEMNAKVHCAPVRLSPITERIQRARQALEQEKK